MKLNIVIDHLVGCNLARLIRRVPKPTLLGKTKILAMFRWVQGGLDTSAVGEGFGAAFLPDIAKDFRWIRTW